MNEHFDRGSLDEQVDRAWLDLRVRLADVLDEGLERGRMNPIRIGTPDGEMLVISLDEPDIAIDAGDGPQGTPLVDEAAHWAFEILHDRWQVLHPAFLDTKLVERPEIPNEEPKLVVPVLGRAEDREQLQSWVEATFRESLTDSLKVCSNGEIRCRTRNGEVAVVKVRNDARIEFATVLAREVSFRKARKAIDRLSNEYFGLKFYLNRDRLIMSRTLIASPFVPEHLVKTLRQFIRTANGLNPVADEVLSERVKVERESLEDARRAQKEAEDRLEKEQERAKHAERIADRRKLERGWVVVNLEKAKKERDEARAELAALKKSLESGSPVVDRTDRQTEGGAA